MTKTNVKNEPGGAGSGLDLETMLSVRARVGESAKIQNVWLDLHVFDGADELIRSETLPMHPVRETAEGDEFGFEGYVYRGTGASPGSVWLAPEARKLQYRLYYENDGAVFSDGLLHQHDVVTDTSAMNPHAVPEGVPA
ncbi:MAG: hypothetical protein ACR2HM_04945 [Acidimicrobiales bacterium]